MLILLKDVMHITQGIQIKEMCIDTVNLILEILIIMDDTLTSPFSYCLPLSPPYPFPYCSSNNEPATTYLLSVFIHLWAHISATTWATVKIGKFLCALIMYM